MNAPTLIIHLFNQNKEARDFIVENGPDTLINSLSINLRYWNETKGVWDYNKVYSS